MRLLKTACVLLSSVFLFAGCDSGKTLPNGSDDAGKTLIYRDTWGVAHIYAPTETEGAYAMGWAQAEDRPVELLKNFLRATGEISSVEGPGSLQTDLISRLFDNYGVAKKNAAQLSERAQALIGAYVEGVNAYYEAHPEDTPEWWKGRKVDPAMITAFARLFLYSWSIDDGFADLKRGGIEPTVGRELRGSNQWAVSPSRSAEGAAILLIDPHLSWWGASRFWEFRIHAGDLVGSGFTLPGFPVIGLGHNENLAWACTTGGPDTADIYESTLKEDDPNSYLVEGYYQPFTVRKVTIEIAGVGPREVELKYSKFGPVVAEAGGKAYSLRTAYANQAGVMNAWFELAFGKDYTAAKRAFDMLQMFPQNVMVADTSGNIFYQRTGRVPKRPEGYDWSRPVDGSTNETAWDGFHEASELVQLLNPPAGYMQNCNIPPDSMLVDSPLQPKEYLDYIFSDRSHGPLGGWSNQRGARAVELLAADDSVSADDAINYALDLQPYGSERWIEVLRQVKGSPSGATIAGGEFAAALDEVLAWDRQLAADSSGALKYYYWRAAIDEAAASGALAGVHERVDNMLASLGEPSPELKFSDAELSALAKLFTQSMEKLKSDWNGLGAVYGDMFRVGRDDESWPLGGGGDHGTRTLRNISYGEVREDGTRRGVAGQTSTQVVVLSKPIRSWTLTPIGQSDRKESPHYNDQAEKLLSPRLMKSTWWTPEELREHIESREVVEIPWRE